MGVEKNVKDTTKTFIAILSLGLVGLLFLIVFGNLSGNLGFSADAITITNETGAYINITGYTLAGASDVGATGYTLTTIWGSTNQSNGTQDAIDNVPEGYTTTILLTNATLSSTTGIVTNASVLVYPNVSLSYTYSRDSQGTQDTDTVITNLTGGAVTFFGFSNVWFTLLAIVLLIIIVIAVIKIVSGKKGGGFTG